MRYTRFSWIDPGSGFSRLFSWMAEPQILRYWFPGIATVLYVAKTKTLERRSLKMSDSTSVPSQVSLAPWPDWLLKIIQSTYPSHPDCPNPKGWELQVLKGIEKGHRNQCATKLTGFYLKKGLRPSEVFFLLIGWNNHNRPPLRESEIRNIVKSVAQIHKTNLATRNNQTQRHRSTNRTNNVTY